MLLNLTKNTVLAEKVSVADNPITRMVGLLGKAQLEKGQALVIKPCNSVHTFFMRFSIDVLFIDKNNKIVKIVSSLKPWRIIPFCFKTRFVIELPAGTIQSTSTQVGDTISRL